jgi:hypothetical protein
MFETLKRLLIGSPDEKHVHRAKDHKDHYRPRPEDPWDGSAAP